MTADLEALRLRLTLVCTGRNLSQAAYDDLDRLLTEADADELDIVVAHMEAVPVSRPEDQRPDPATTARFVALDAASRRRREEHTARITTTARHLGAEVGRYERTLADAERALERLCDQRDGAVADLADVRLVPWREATDLAAREFRAALRASEQERGLSWAS